MTHVPSIDYSCTRCGARHIYQLARVEEPPTEEAVSAAPHHVPSLDFRCSRCGAGQTYTLAPANPSV